MAAITGTQNCDIFDGIVQTMTQKLHKFRRAAKLDQCIKEAKAASKISELWT